MVGLDVQSLPTEILEEIILYALELRGGVDLNTAQGIWICSHVSRRWRAVALARCSFWSRITIEEGLFLPSSAVAILETILVRSNDQPITLNLTYNGPGLPLILDKFVSHSYRLQTATFQMTAYTLFEKCIFPALQALELVCPLVLRQSFHEQGIHEAPALRSLTIRGPTTLYYLQTLTLPWSQLTIYRAYRCNENDQLHLLPLLPNVIEYLCLTGSVCPSVSDRNPMAGHVICSRLENLVVDGTKLMDALIAPSLQKVQIPLALVQMQALYRLVQRSSCHIHALTLVGGHEHVFPESIISLLHSLPYLTTLQINHRRNRSPLFFDHLVHGGDCAPILPHLQHLLVSSKYTSESHKEEIESLVRVLCSRNGSCQGVEALRSLWYELHQSYVIHPRRHFFLMQEVYEPLVRHKGVVDVRLSLL